MEEKAVRPFWCHSHGDKMDVKALGTQNDFLVIQGSAAEVVINRAPNGWSVTWRINHGPGEVLGKTWLSEDDLIRAFGLRDVPQGSEGLLEHYGGTTAEQGKFIRYRDYLNIPGPGTGSDGDPNVSIKLKQEIKEAVKELIYNQRLI